MLSMFESKSMLNTAKAFEPLSKRIILLFPDLEWDIRKAGYTIDDVQFLSVVCYLTLASFFVCIAIIILPLTLVKGMGLMPITLGVSCLITVLMFAYFLLQPKVEIRKRARLIDTDLEYMLKDMKIQLTSGVPLFDTVVNISKGNYGECSLIASGIVQEVNSGKSVTDVLDNVGMWSPSEYMRNVLWQTVNAVKSGSDIKKALDAISEDIRVDKENKIKAYAQELNMWGLIYMMVAIVMPSMGVTLLVILSSFMGGAVINETLFWVILGFLIVFQMIFISFVRSKRPMI